jgi:transcription elongation factor GreA
MAAHRPRLPNAERPIAAPPECNSGVLLTVDDFEALVCELETLRDRHRAALARHLRDARTFGSPGENDDVLTVLEEATVDEARIAQLEDLVRTATVVEGEAVFDGRAGLGCAVQVADERGRTNAYNLIGRRLHDSPPGDVTMASPVGRALTGATAGDVVEVALPNGRARVLHVLEVRPAVAVPQIALKHTAKAA